MSFTQNFLSQKKNVLYQCDFKCKDDVSVICSMNEIHEDNYNFTNKYFEINKNHPLKSKFELEKIRYLIWKCYNKKINTVDLLECYFLQNSNEKDDNLRAKCAYLLEDDIEKKYTMAFYANDIFEPNFTKAVLNKRHYSNQILKKPIFEDFLFFIYIFLMIICCIMFILKFFKFIKRKNKARRPLSRNQNK